ncbi:hypothetical protein GQ42DRAFT_164160 [Ramicandelaber brevisporus]|nr:hypothetical protein GQ42DRAFT_164160 [Ramicandelaber brevisporus]
MIVPPKHASQPADSDAHFFEVHIPAQGCGHGGGGGDGGNHVFTAPFDSSLYRPLPSQMSAPAPPPYAMPHTAPIPPAPPRPPVGLAPPGSPYPPNVSVYTFLAPPRPDGSSANFTVIQGHDENGKPFRHIHSHQDFYITKEGGIIMPHAMPPTPNEIPPGPKAFEFMKSVGIDIANWKDWISWSLYPEEKKSGN